jgi:L-ascorbate metabolism protein UlaG (beta-lactamase superfamily)
MKTTSPLSLLALGLMISPLALVPAAAAAEKPLPDSIPAADGPVKVYPINHATLALQWKGRTIDVDPVGGAKAFEGLPRPDLILVTHIHGDHFSKETLTALAGPDTKLICPASVAAELPADFRGRATTLGNGQTQEVIGIRVEAVPAYNLAADRQKFHPKGRDNGYVVTLGGKRFYFSGDTEDVPEMLALENIDVAFVCMNLPYTMNVERAARAVRAFKPRVVYPYHYRGADLQKFKELVGADSGIEVRLREWYPKP